MFNLLMRGGDVAAVTITHADGGVSEVMIHLDRDGFFVDIDPSHTNPVTVGVDGDLVYEDGDVL